MQPGSGTGINPWWRYQEENVPGGGHIMVNVGTGNFVLQQDDMSVPHKGIATAFRRTYNSQSQHDVNGSDGAAPSMNGNGWTSTFDAHLSGSPTGTISVWDIDGARYDYGLASDGVTWNSLTPGQHATLTFDGGCGYMWTKKSGTTYYFWQPSGACANYPYFATLQAGYYGRLYQIIGRNRNTTMTFNYGWDQGDSSATGKISTIYATTESGLTATLSFADVSGHRLLQQILFPDGGTAVTYGYDTLGNLTSVSRPPNNAAGTRPVQSFGYYYPGKMMGWVAGPRWNASGGSDGAMFYIGYDAPDGSPGPLGTLTAIAHVGVVNPSIPDGSGSTTLQPGAPSGVVEYNHTWYGTGAGAATLYVHDTDGHETIWAADQTDPRRVRQTQECTAMSGWNCSGSWLVTNETWDASNNLVSEVDPRGGKTDYAYDVDGNTVAVAAPAPSSGAFRPTSLYSYGPHDNVVAFCDPNATHAMQADWTSPPVAPVPGQGGLCPTQSTAATRYQWSYPSYEPFGQLASSIAPGTPAAPNGYQRTYAYDLGAQGGADYGLPTSVTGAAISQNDATTPSRQPQQTFWYDTNGNLVCSGTGNGQWLLGYDALGRVTSTADPDDASSGTGVCGKTGAQPNWNTTARTTYFPDGSVASKQTASQAANGIATTFTYDVDGNVKTEMHHYGCLTVSSCTVGVTTKWYDGADRLVEVQAPYDANDVQAYPWSTRYIYDLSGGNVTSYRGVGLAGYGNLVSTQELLSGTVWAPAFLQRYPITSGSWTDVRATSYDALNRPVSNYEAAFGDQPKSTNAYDAAGSEGLLSSVNPATNERKTFVYDGDGRETDVVYPDDPTGAVTPAVHQTLDADGRVTTRNTSVLGTETIGYNATGEVTLITEPASLGGGTISYSYFADGLRSSAGYADANGAFPNALQYTYRTDGRRDRLSLANGTAFTWTYTAAGRMLTQSDPLTGTTVSPSATYDSIHSAKPFYPSTVTYSPWRVAYDGFGRLNAVTLPVSLFSYTGAQYDLEDGIAQVTDSGYSPPSSGYASTALTCLESSIRNEKTPLARGYLTSSPCTMSPNPPGEINGAQVVPGDGSSAGSVSARTDPSGNNGQNWTLDARSGMLLHITRPLGSDTVGASYTYDASGRLTQDVEAATVFIGSAASPAKQMSAWCPVIYAGTSAYPNGFTCYENGTRTKTYDAESRLRTETFNYIPEYSVNGPTYTGTSYGFATYGAYWEDSTGYGQPANLQAVDYGATSHPMRFSLYHPDRAGNAASESRIWLWDGNDRFLECGAVNGTCQSPSLSVEGLADYDLVHGTVMRVNDHNHAGQVVMSRNGTSFSPWSDTRSWTNGKTFLSPCSLDNVYNSANPTICDPQHDGKLTPDGWALDMETWQGVRTFDPAVGQWNSPDAYAGEVHDPMSQKPFMWNRSNPYQYSDPSGYCVAFLAVVCAWALVNAPELTAAGAFAVEAAGGAGGGGRGVWARGWASRGVTIENALAKNTASAFPVIDRVIAGEGAAASSVTSIKSMDLSGSSYQAASRIASRIKGYVDAVANFKGAADKAQVVTADASTLRVLELVIPNMPLSQAQQAGINAASQYATSQGVALHIVKW